MRNRTREPHRLLVRRKVRFLPLLVMSGLAASALGLTSCGERTVDMDQRMFEASTVSEEELIRGREAYMLYCVGCHGEDGDGKGEAADWLEPKPRDFTKGAYKYAGVPSGELPRDEDIMRTLNRGLSASSMPSWKLLDDDTKAALISYLKRFSPRFADEPQGQALPIPPDPYRSNPAAATMAAARGKVVYHGLAGCYNCHPSYATHEEMQAAAAEMETVVPQQFAANLYFEKIKRSETWQIDTRPPDFTRRLLSNGTELEDIFRVINSGVGGTAMPTWADVLEPNDIWAMAYYVRSLSQMRGTEEGRQLRARLGIR